MARGRRPTPTAIKEATGNPGKRKIAGAEPSPTPLFEAPPPELNREAAAEWRRVMPELKKWGLYSLMDRAMLMAYCIHFAVAMKAARGLARGMCYETTGRNGKMRRAKPEVAIFNEAWKQVARFGAEFGFSPAARARLQGTAQGDLFDGPAQESEPAESNVDTSNPWAKFG